MTMRTRYFSLQILLKDPCVSQRVWAPAFSASGDGAPRIFSKWSYSGLTSATQFDGGPTRDPDRGGPTGLPSGHSRSHHSLRFRPVYGMSAQGWWDGPKP